MDKELAMRAWNAALEHFDEVLQTSEVGVSVMHHLEAPCKAFEEWWEREVMNPPDGIESWGN